MTVRKAGVALSERGTMTKAAIARKRTADSPKAETVRKTPAATTTASASKAAAQAAPAKTKATAPRASVTSKATSKGASDVKLVEQPAKTRVVKRAREEDEDEDEDGNEMRTTSSSSEMEEPTNEPSHAQLEKARVDAEKNLLFVKGGVPGPTGTTVLVRRSVKATVRAAHKAAKGK